MSEERKYTIVFSEEATRANVADANGTAFSEEAQRQIAAQIRSDDEFVPCIRYDEVVEQSDGTRLVMRATLVSMSLVRKRGSA